MFELKTKQQPTARPTLESAQKAFALLIEAGHRALDVAVQDEDEAKAVAAYEALQRASACLRRTNDEHFRAVRRP